MNTDKLKAHVKRHREAYIVGIVCLAGITYLVMRSRHTGLTKVPDGHESVTVRPLSIFANQKNNIVTVIEREGRGHPGYLIKCLETGEIFSSQAVAADAAGTSPWFMSGHINGRFPDVNGRHFDRVSVVT